MKISMTLLMCFAATGCLCLPMATLASPIADDETPGQQLAIATNVGIGYNCGRVSTPLYCYGIPLSIDGLPSGTLWLDTYLSGYNAGHGFIVWYGVADLAEATITSNATVGGTSMPSQVTVTFAGGTNDGDNGSYTGTMTLNFTYYYSRGGGGRGGAGAGWRYICTGGTINITYVQ